MIFHHPCASSSSSSRVYQAVQAIGIHEKAGEHAPAVPVRHRVLVREYGSGKF